MARSATLATASISVLNMFDIAANVHFCGDRAEYVSEALSAATFDIAGAALRLIYPIKETYFQIIRAIHPQSISFYS